VSQRPPMSPVSPFANEGRAVRAANAVVLALVVALLDLEQRRTGGKVRPPMNRRTLE
jgi:hypothetical protein